MIRVEHGDMLDVLPRLAAEGVRVHAVITDPPYHLAMAKRLGNSHTADVEKNFTKTIEGQGANPFKLAARGFMGKQWDGGDIAFRPETWRLCWDLLPPGGYLLAFAATRTYHRIACAIEDAGFEIRDMLAWLYGSGFPKSLNVSKAIDRAAGAEREVVGVRRYADGTQGHWGLSNKYAQDAHTKSLNGTMPKLETAPATDAARAWDGWGTSLKPSHEPVCFARKPLQGTVAANVLAHGTGALNIDACRIAAEEGFEEYVAKTARPNSAGQMHIGSVMNRPASPTVNTSPLGRWPANCAHDGSDEVVGAFPDTQSGSGEKSKRNSQWYEGGPLGSIAGQSTGGDSGSAARFFYSAKADAGDRLSSKHPTVKPVDLMRWLVRLVTPPGGTVLDPFAGSGTTAMACMAEGFDCIAVEREAEYAADIRRRIAHVSGQDTPLFAEP